MDEILKKFDQEKPLLSLLLSFIDSEEENDDFSGLNSFIQKQEDSTKTDILYTMLSLLSNISQNHHRHSHFFTKIEKILFHFKDHQRKNIR